MPKKLFTSDYQPVNRRKPTGRAKVLYTTRVEPETKDYLKAHKVKGGKVLDEYVKEKQK